MHHQNLNKASKLVYTQLQAYIIPTFTLVLIVIKKPFGLSGDYCLYISFNLNREVIRPLNTFELIKTLSYVTTRNNPNEKC